MTIPKPEPEAEPIHQTTLREIAHARSGDKGNHSNIGVFAYRPEDYTLLVAALQPESVARHFAHRAPSAVVSHLLPRLQGLNVVLFDVLDGGVNDALNLDMHGKALSFALLAITIDLPAGHWAVKHTTHSVANGTTTQDPKETGRC